MISTEDCKFYITFRFIRSMVPVQQNATEPIGLLK